MMYKNISNKQDLDKKILLPNFLINLKQNIIKAQKSNEITIDTKSTFGSLNVPQRNSPLNKPMQGIPSQGVSVTSKQGGEFQNTQIISSKGKRPEQKSVMISLNDHKKIKQVQKHVDINLKPFQNLGLKQYHLQKYDTDKPNNENLKEKLNQISIKKIDFQKNKTNINDEENFSMILEEINQKEETPIYQNNVNSNKFGDKMVSVQEFLLDKKRNHLQNEMNKNQIQSVKSIKNEDEYMVKLELNQNFNSKHALSNGYLQDDPITNQKLVNSQRNIKMDGYKSVQDSLQKEKQSENLLTKSVQDKTALDILKKKQIISQKNQKGQTQQQFMQSYYKSYLNKKEQITPSKQNLKFLSDNKMKVTEKIPEIKKNTSDKALNSDFAFASIEISQDWQQPANSTQNQFNSIQIQPAIQSSNKYQQIQIEPTNLYCDLGSQIQRQRYSQEETQNYEQIEEFKQKQKSENNAHRFFNKTQQNYVTESKNTNGSNQMQQNNYKYPSEKKSNVQLDFTTSLKDLQLQSKNQLQQSNSLFNFTQTQNQLMNSKNDEDIIYAKDNKYEKENQKYSNFSEYFYSQQQKKSEKSKKNYEQSDIIQEKTQNKIYQNILDNYYLA